MGKRTGWITAVAVLHFINGAFVALYGLGTLIAFQFVLDLLAGIYDISGLRGMSLIPGLILLLIAAGHILVGVYLLKLAPWAQIVSIVLNTLSLLASLALAVLSFSSSPTIVSTGIIGVMMALVYGLCIYGLLNHESNRAFETGGRAADLCPTCGRPLDPSWDRCPYCQPFAPAGAETFPGPAEAMSPAAPWGGGTPGMAADQAVQPVLPGLPTGIGPADFPAAAFEPSPPGYGGATAPGTPYAPTQAAYGGSGMAPATPYAPAPSPYGNGGPAPASYGQPAGSSAPPVAKTEIIRTEPGTVAWLAFSGGFRTGQEVRLSGELNIGRDPSRNELVLDAPTVSGQHAKIRLIEGEYILYDLGSSNGTHANGQEIHKHTLQDGDQLRFGQVEMTFMMIKPKPEVQPQPEPDQPAPAE